MMDVPYHTVEMVCPVIPVESPPKPSPYSQEAAAVSTAEVRINTKFTKHENYYVVSSAAYRPLR